ncbi:protein serine/threonine kinase protein [Trichomonas vaginalis G3]|uniref:protein serine/threonine kinase protein n=1 Tax=Trichomonas vaginalis (strain ATCC PRA-98 / G3) TaxID=412133 RepID=UPI0021E5F7DE|nr:protein serine/threonine kinase protein [Trichomonas vaginalis G3]KAI5538810.1 protein serine/threonine kinase protein [Trichomonas vaginalis G3]
MEMVHISNKNLGNSIEKYVQMVTTLSRGPSIENLMRAAIGVTALHQFGNNDFTRLTGIFDRLIPQNDLEYVRFTSWCAGKLVHHPSFEQSRYVAHLLERLLGWVRAYGRRSRHLAAVCLLEYLSLNAGSEVVVFFEQWQSAVWTLVSHPSMQLIRATASAVNMLTRAILRYRRSDLDAYLSFFTQLIYRLLSFGSPFKVYAALKILEQLISSCPDFFSSKFGELYDMISDATSDGPLLVQAESYVSISHLTYVDSKQFSDLYADSLLEKTDEILLEFPRCIGASLSRMINNIPEYMETKIADIKQYAINLVNDPDWSFDLLTAATNKFGEKFLPIDEDLIMKLMKTPMTNYFNNFFIAYTRAIGEKINPTITEALATKIIDEFSTSETILALDLIAGLPGFALKQNGTLNTLITEKSMFEADEIRKAIPAALYSLAKSTNQPEHIRETTEKLFQLALFDPSTDVRLSILRALKRDAIKELADPEAVKFLQLFANDDSTSVRNLVFQTIAALGDINPMYVSNITRHALLEHFYSIKNVPGIRLRSRVIKTLPDLITATGATMKIYAKPFMEIAMDILLHPPEKSTLENFLEQEAVTNIEIGLFDSIALIAPIAPTIIAEDSYHLIPFLCNKLHTSEDRALLLSDLHLLFVLSSPPAAVVQYRIMAPLILSACSKLLANTQSRKVRMAILRVIGSLGVLDVHQRSPPMGSQAPTNLDDRLTRSFFTPSRDLDNPIDDTLLLKPETCEQCYVNVVATALLKILNNDELSELYGDTVTSLCDVLKNPRMFMLTYFDQFFNRFLVILDTASESDMQLYLPILSKLIVESSHNSTPFTERVLNFVVSHYNDKLGVLYLDVIIALVTTLRDGFVPYATTAISLLVSCLEAMKSQNEEVCDRVFKAFSQTGIYAVDLLYLIVPQICDVIVSEQALVGVRKLAIQSLKRIAQDAELILYLGPIVRAINYALGCKCADIKDDVFDLIFTLLKTQGRPFVKNAMPLINYIRRTGSANSEFEAAIESAQQIENFTPTITATPPIIRRKKATEHPFSEDTLIARAITPTLGYGRHLEQWLHSFMIVCINSSPNEDIRCCTTLATNYQPLAMMLFKIAFFSCWKKLSQQGKSVITNTFHSLLIATENYEVVTNEIMDLIFFMSKFEDMKIPLKHLVSSALRYGSNAFALCIQQDAIQRGVIKKKMAKMLIDTFINLGEWNNAIAVWKQYSSMIPNANKEDFLSKLHMWDVALPIYEQKYKQSKNPNSFNGYIKSLSNLGQWPTVVENVKNFEDLNLTAKEM